MTTTALSPHPTPAIATAEAICTLLVPVQSTEPVVGCTSCAFAHTGGHSVIDWERESLLFLSTCLPSDTRKICLISSMALFHKWRSLNYMNESHSRKTTTKGLSCFYLIHVIVCHIYHNWNQQTWKYLLMLPYPLKLLSGEKL